MRARAILRFGLTFVALTASGTAHAESTGATPMLAVRIESRLSRSERASLLEACSSAYVESECAESNDAKSEPPLVGRVEDESDGRVLVEVTWTHGGNARTISRELSFLPEDQPLERAKAAGLTLGVIAGSFVQQAAASPEAPEPPPTPQAESASEPKETPSPHVIATLLGGAGRDPKLAGFEWGVAGRVELGLGKSSHSVRFGLAGFGQTLDSPALSLLRLDPTLGVGMRLGTGPVTGLAALDAGAEWLSAQATSSTGSSGDRAARLVPLLRASLGLRAALSDSFGLELDGAASFLPSATDIFVEDRLVAGTSGFQFALLAGAFVTLDK